MMGNSAVEGLLLGGMCDQWNGLEVSLCMNGLIRGNVSAEEARMVRIDDVQTGFWSYAYSTYCTSVWS